MSKIVVFNMVSVDGYYAGVDDNIDWHNVDDEFSQFANEQTQEFGTHIYGRITYELMARFWPRTEAIKEDPIVAPLMNNTPKIVFSKTLTEVHETDLWKNITLLHDIDIAAIAKAKASQEKNLVIFGSGKIVQQFTNLGLIDEYRLLVNPIILGGGKLLFENVHVKQNLKLINSRTFKNGNVLLSYSTL